MKNKMTEKQKIVCLIFLLALVAFTCLYVYDAQRRQFSQTDPETIKYGRGIGGSLNIK